MTSIYKASDFMPLVKVKKVIADVLEKGLIESVYHKNVLMQFLKEPDDSPLPSNEDERKFTLKEMIACWGAAERYAHESEQDKRVYKELSMYQYFKQKLNIDITRKTVGPNE